MKKYKIIGYKGKQVRDNIHSIDVAKFIEEYFKKPRKGEVYNLGGGKKNSISIIEAINKIEKLSKIKMITSYIKKNRIGDHICYYSDLNKMKRHYPKWKITKNLDKIFEEIYLSWKKRKKLDQNNITTSGWFKNQLFQISFAKNLSKIINFKSKIK